MPNENLCTVRQLLQDIRNQQENKEITFTHQCRTALI